MSNRRLTNHIVVITGASGGIGREMAMLAASQGALPILIARSLDKLKEAQRVIKEHYQIEADVHSLDISDLDAIQDVFTAILKKHGHIDVLINNAGFGIFDYFTDATLKDIKSMFDVNVVGLMACTRMAVPHMIERRSGHIINIASIAGKLATPKSTVYSASKHAVLGFTNGLRMELEDQGVQVTAVNPGPIRTNFFHIADPEGGYTASVNRFMIEPEHVASKVIAAIGTKKREINLPWTMSTGSRLYQLFPRLVEAIAGGLFKMK
ncbi:hypothetical protein EV207_102278 [Scopulibacillus darangshiensis]|uniref:Short-subunit dehydrogenase n=1 Tax=Scopulibacillus darangshiensis TaxID=442528 RepID=A0A4R2PCZ0_9BACL|nr:SDR family oxidoreductase [Scopulibacillus darangshiensis]TCP31785.1 hypothetical protein EV207_102278 [Scopulibacillus darangshiensis]